MVQSLKEQPDTVSLYEIVIHLRRLENMSIREKAVTKWQRSTDRGEKIIHTLTAYIEQEWWQSGLKPCPWGQYLIGRLATIMVSPKKQIAGKNNPTMCVHRLYVLGEYWTICTNFSFTSNNDKTWLVRKLANMHLMSCCRMNFDRYQLIM